MEDNFIIVTKGTVLAWILYMVVLGSTYLLNSELNNNMKFDILGTIFCPVFGGVFRCNAAISASVLGMILGCSMLVFGILSTVSKRKYLKEFKKIETKLSVAYASYWLVLLLLFSKWTNETGAYKPEVLWLSGYVAINVTAVILISILSFIEKGVLLSKE